MCGQQKSAASGFFPRRRFSVVDQSEHFTAKPPLKKKVFVQYLFGGPEGIRTLDLSDANRTLSQLSYKPVFTWYPAIIHVFRKNARGISPSAQTLARENAIIIYSYFTYGESVVYY